MSLRFALLGLAIAKPSTGYEFTRLFDLSLSHAWQATHSQIYPELHRLQEDGLVEVVGEGPRNSKTYAATDAGKSALRAWLLDRPASVKVRDEGALRLFLLGVLDPADRHAALERELVALEAQVTMLRELAEKTRESAEREPFAPMVELGLRLTPAAMGWMQDQLAAAERELGEPGEPGEPDSAPE